MKRRIILICALVIISLCVFACGNKSDKESKKNSQSEENSESKESDDSIPSTANDLVPVTSIEQLWNFTDAVVNAEIVKKTESESIIEYELKVNEWIKGEKESTSIILKTENNRRGLTTDINYFDFDLNKTYVFFMGDNNDYYGMACENAGLIQVEEDNSVIAAEHDLVFKNCKTYEDVRAIINTQLDSAE